MSVRTDFQGHFQDFVVGETYRHARGKTVTELDNVLITNLVLNTAEPHFNEHAAQQDPMFKQRIVFGGINLAMVLGLAAQDTARHALREIGLDKIRLFAPVHHGDTLYAYSKVLAAMLQPESDGGIVTFQHDGFNQRNTHILSCERRVLIRSRPV